MKTLSKEANAWVEHFCEARNHAPHSEAYKGAMKKAEEVWAKLHEAERKAATAALYVP